LQLVLDQSQREHCVAKGVARRGASIRGYILLTPFINEGEICVNLLLHSKFHNERCILQPPVGATTEYRFQNTAKFGFSPSGPRGSKNQISPYFEIQHSVVAPTGGAETKLNLT